MLSINHALFPPYRELSADEGYAEHIINDRYSIRHRIGIVSALVEYTIRGKIA